MKAYLALIAVGIIAVATIQEPLIPMGPEITVIALGVLALITIIVYGLCKVWERRLNA